MENNNRKTIIKDRKIQKIYKINNLIIIKVELNGKFIDLDLFIIIHQKKIIIQI
jgi:hypothetical protein